MVLPVTPQVFDRIEFRRIWWEVLDGDLAVQGIQELTDQPTAVRWQPVPDHQQRCFDIPEKVSEEHNGLFLADRFFEDLEIKVPDSHAGCHRYGLPVEVVLEDGSLTTRRPGATPMGTLAQPAFVDEDDRAPFFGGFFLMPGQALRFHWSMASSLRSTARPAGRCGLQFSCRKSFQTCPE
jgi:hypothetical protein